MPYTSLYYLYTYSAKNHQKERGSLILEICSSDVSIRVKSTAEQVQTAGNKFESGGGQPVKISMDQQDSITRSAIPFQFYQSATQHQEPSVKESHSKLYYPAKEHYLVGFSVC